MSSTHEIDTTQTQPPASPEEQENLIRRSFAATQLESEGTQTSEELPEFQLPEIAPQATNPL